MIVSEDIWMGARNYGMVAIELYEDGGFRGLGEKKVFFCRVLSFIKKIYKIDREWQVYNRVPQAATFSEEN